MVGSMKGLKIAYANILPNLAFLAHIISLKWSKIHIVKILTDYF